MTDAVPSAPIDSDVEDKALALLGDSNDAAGNAHVLLYLQHDQSKPLAIDLDELLIITQINDPTVAGNKRVFLGDRVLTVNNKTCSSLTQFTATIANAPKEVPVPVTFRSSIGRPPKQSILAQLDPSLDRDGFELSNRHFQHQDKALPLNLIIRCTKNKVIVTRTVQTSIAWHVFLPGDRILAIDNELVHDNKEAKTKLLAAVTSHSCANVTVLRPQSRTAKLKVDALLKRIHVETKGKDGALQQTTAKTNQESPKNTKGDSKNSMPAMATTIKSKEIPLNKDVQCFIKAELKRRAGSRKAVLPKSNLRVKTHTNQSTETRTNLEPKSAPMSSPSLQTIDSVYGRVKPLNTNPPPGKAKPPVLVFATKEAVAKKKDLIKIAPRPSYVNIGCDTPANAILRKPKKSS